MSCPPPTGMDSPSPGTKGGGLTWAASFYFGQLLRCGSSVTRGTSRKAISRLQLAPEESCLIGAGPDAAIGPAQGRSGAQRENDSRSVDLGFDAGTLGGGRQREIHGLADDDGVGLADGIHNLPSENVGLQEKRRRI